MSTLDHRDVVLAIILSNTMKRIDIARDQSIDIKGTGIMVRIPAVYAPKATNYNICDEIYAVIIFLQDGAIELQLNSDIINYLNKIREVAIKII